MKKIIEFIKQYRIYILSVFLVFFFFRSCSKSGEVRKLEKTKLKNVEMIDSLEFVIQKQNDTIGNISEVIRIEKIKIHMEYDNWISQKDRGQQLMELHLIVKDKLQKLEK